MGHLLALLTIVIWATTYVSTKILLKNFQPVEILLLRFIIGFLILLLIFPKRLKVKEIKHELYFALAGLFISQIKKKDTSEEAEIEQI